MLTADSILANILSVRHFVCVIYIHLTIRKTMSKCKYFQRWKWRVAISDIPENSSSTGSSDLPSRGLSEGSNGAGGPTCVVWGAWLPGLDWGSGHWPRMLETSWVLSPL